MRADMIYGMDRWKDKQEGDCAVPSGSIKVLEISEHLLYTKHERIDEVSGKIPIHQVQGSSTNSLFCFV